MSNTIKHKTIIVIDEKLPYLLNGINHATGGASVQSQNWILGFESQGFTPIIVSSLDIENKSSYFVERHTKIKGLKNPFSLLKVSLRFFKILKKYKPNFIYISIPFWSNVLFILPANLLGVKIVQRVSNDNLVLQRAKQKFDKLKYLFYEWGLKKSSIILCQNEYQKDNFRGSFPEKHIIKLHNPFIYKSCEIIDQRKYIAWIGLFQYQKNLPMLYEIAKNSPNIEFRIAGKLSEFVDDRTRNSLDELKELKNIMFMGLIPRNKISDFLSEAYCLLNTSRYEGFSNTYLEALSVNTPIVTRAATDPDGIIKKNRLGFVAEEYDELPSLLDKVIRENLEDRSYLSDYVKKNHSPIIQAKKLLKYI